MEGAGEVEIRIGPDGRVQIAVLTEPLLEMAAALAPEDAGLARRLAVARQLRERETKRTDETADTEHEHDDEHEHEETNP